MLLLFQPVCAKFNLNTYIQLLNQSSVKITQENVISLYNKMLNQLNSLATAWPPENVSRSVFL